MRKYYHLLSVLILLFLLILFFYLDTSNYNNKSLEEFTIEFGTPPETTSTDQQHIQGLLEIGSQAHENTMYDSVSTHYLGDLSRPTQPPPPPPPPDPVCFDTPSNSGKKIPTDLDSYTPDCCGSTEATYPGLDLEDDEDCID